MSCSWLSPLLCKDFKLFLSLAECASHTQHFLNTSSHIMWVARSREYNYWDLSGIHPWCKWIKTCLNMAMESAGAMQTYTMQQAGTIYCANRRMPAAMPSFTFLRVGSHSVLYSVHSIWPFKKKRSSMCTH